MGPIWATHICANPYGTHVEPSCTPCICKLNLSSSSVVEITGFPESIPGDTGMFAGSLPRASLTHPMKGHPATFEHIHTTKTIWQIIMFTSCINFTGSIRLILCLSESSYKRSYLILRYCLFVSCPYMTENVDLVVKYISTQ